MERGPSRVETASTGSGSDVPLPEDLVTCPITFEPYQVANEEDGDDFIPIDPPCHHTLSKIALKDVRRFLHLCIDPNSALAAARYAYSS